MTHRAAVVGGGIAGLAAAERLVERLGGDAVVLVESEPRLGGKILTVRRDGFVLEGGPDCFLAMKPGGMAMCRHLGIEDRVIGTNPELRRSFVKRHGRLHPLPDGITGLVPSRITPLMTTPILSLGGRLRAGLELLVPRRDSAEPESVGGFVRRRFGREAWDYLIEPLLSGIFAGDGDQLSLSATFPQLKATEEKHGSLLRPMLRARLAGPSKTGGPPTGFVTLAGGLREIVERIEARLPSGAARLGVKVTGLSRMPGGPYRLALSDGSTISAESVILAAPAFSTADVVAGLDPALAEALREIPFVTTATVSLAFPRSAVARPLPGYGYVCPRVEAGQIVALTWTSNKFPGRVPEDGVLVRAFVGRSGQEDIVNEPDERLVELVREELKSLHGITAAPSFSWVARWPRGMPQYTLGHEGRLARIAEGLGRWPGLFVAGSSYRGVGIPDCIQSGWTAADAALAGVVAA
jgi:oxygen-dependent protoporphyrinogen oxidase